ncbi:hypothetical protein [Hymenobacter lapidiphilus]|uniref:Uncharacterized protein n=1 Tax=Hymenobacter lapidiphilus TaxID=2608003 RepID=A0A7Y7U442_9BACT|nr:hypothetical protein [Hymenobacter lapidiphilus]NVO29877.1 hypothetical protein [Hymenobacter lapidiphilus]
MKHLSSLLRKLTAVAAVGIALTSCNRAEYAMLPKTGSAYHGTQRSTIIKPTPAPEVAVAPQVAAEAVAMPEAVVAPVAAPAAVATAAPVAKAAPVTAAAPAKGTKAAKLNFMQKALVNKITKQADKLAAKAGIVKKSSETAATNRLEGKLRQGLILMLVGLLVGLLGVLGGTIGAIFSILGSIIFIIGVVLVILYLLDEI